MSKIKSALRSALFCAVLSTTPQLLAQEGKPAAFAVDTDGTSKFITTPARGGLAIGPNAVSPRETFKILDLTGGELEDADTIKIFWETSVWRENEGKVNRVAIRGANEIETVFTVVKDGTLYKLRAPSGAFVARENEDRSALMTTQEEGEALPIEILWQESVPE